MAAQFSRGTVLERLNYVRQFAEHVAWFDPATEVPVLTDDPTALIVPPAIFTDQQIDTLLVVGRQVDPTSPGGFLANATRPLTVTGMRISEARNLNDDDITIDDDAGDGSGWVRVTTRSSASPASSHSARRR